MPDWLAGPLATGGLGWLIGVALVAGMVRGFAGFGTAMIFLPVAAQFLSPFEALTVLVVKDLIGPLPNLPRAWRDGHRADLLWLSAGMVVGVPLGLWALSMVAPEVFRYGVSLIALTLLLLLVGGVRYNGPMSPPLVFGTGGLGGLLAGAAGLPGPPVILLYMAAPHAPQVIRANTMMYLSLSNVVMIAMLAAFGQLVFGAIVLGLVLTVPYLAGNMIGAAIFRPSAERAYRIAAYCIIAVSALHGLPLFD